MWWVVGGGEGEKIKWWHKRVQQLSCGDAGGEDGRGGGGGMDGKEGRWGRGGKGS